MRHLIRSGFAFLIFASPALAQAQEFTAPGWYVMATFEGGYSEPYPKEIVYGPYASQSQCEEEGIPTIPYRESVEAAGVIIACEYLDEWAPAPDPPQS